MRKIVFLDRGTIAPQIALRRPTFEHELVEYASTKPEQVASRLAGATVTITNKVAIRADAIYAYLEAWIESLGLDQPAALVGHSMGGYLSLRYSLDHPERVSGLVLINPLYTLEQLSPFIRLVSRRPEVSERALRRAPEWLMNTLLGWDPSKPADFSAQAPRQIANEYKRASPHIVYLTRCIPDLTPALSLLNIPTLVVWGDRDQTLNPSLSKCW